MIQKQFISSVYANKVKKVLVWTINYYIYATNLSFGCLTIKTTIVNRKTRDLLFKNFKLFRDMKKSVVKDVLLIATFAGFAYLVVRNYKQRKEKEREALEFLHFQLF